jgi:hypothetical protein
MRRLVLLLSASLLFAVCGLSGVVYAEDSFVDKFIGSPLLILAGILVIVAVAFVYHKMIK